MRVVIAGAGEVGTHLARMLSQEKHDIILMDTDDERLHISSTGAEILPVEGNPTSLHDLREAGVKGADLFVSVTPEETTNITACILASNLGAVKTFARINNYEYLQPENKEFFESLGIGSMIYPEMLAGKEIVTAVQRPWTRQYWELSGGAIILLAVKIRENSQLVNTRLSELPGTQKMYHIVAIKRKNETIIPFGSDHIEAGDLVFFTTTKEHIKDIQLHAGKKNPEVKKVIIMGGSRIAIRASQYLPSNIRVKIIEINKEKSHRIAEVVPGNVLIINGDGRDMDLLVQEGIRDSQAFIALTENESTNILACLAAKRFGVAKTIAKIENLDYIPLAETWISVRSSIKADCGKPYLPVFARCRCIECKEPGVCQCRCGRACSQTRFQDYTKTRKRFTVAERYDAGRVDSRRQTDDDRRGYSNTGFR